MRKLLALSIAVLIALGLWLAFGRAGGTLESDQDRRHLEEEQGGHLTTHQETLDRPGEPPATGGRKAIDARQETVPELVIGGIVMRVPPDGTKADAEPLGGAKIAVGVQDPKLEQVTGPDGRFRLTMPDRGDRPMATLMTVRAEKPLMKWSKRIDFTEGMSGPESLVVYMLHAPIATGQVVTPGGRPVPGVTVGHKKSDVSMVTDGNGKFALEGLPHANLTSPLQLEDRLLPSKAGWTVVSIDVPGFSEDLVWQPVQIVMVESQAFTVQAQTRGGAPLPGLQFRLDLSPDSTYSTNEGAVFGFRFDGQFQTTDAKGMATFQSVPSHVHLRLRLAGDVDFEALDSSGVLVANGTDHPGMLRPLTARPGEPPAAKYIPRAHFTLRGVVREADGSPAANARIRLDPIATGSPGAQVHPSKLRTGDAGTFETLVAVSGDIQEVLVRAQSTVGERRSYSPFGGTVFPDPLHFAQDRVRVDAPHSVALQLGALGHLKGRILRPDGEPLADYVTVTLSPMGEAAPMDFTLGAYSPTSRSVTRGTFEFKGLPPGAYRVEALHAHFGTQSISDVAFDAEDAVLRFEEAQAATVNIQVQSAHGVRSITLDSGGIQVARYRIDPPLLVPGSKLTDPLGYDGGALTVSSGSAGLHTPGVRGTASVNYHSGSESTLNVAPGLHWIGVRGTDLDGRQLFPAGTGPVRIGAGKQTLQFTLHGAASLSGRVSRPSAAAEEQLVELHLPNGTRVPCIGSRQGMQPSFRVAANGDFKVNTIPACPLEVWVGTRTELSAGRPAKVRQIQPNAGDALNIRIDL